MESIAPTWPTELLLVRHGESTGNVARAAALASGQPAIDIGTAEADVPLSPTGEEQSLALGTWLGANETQPSIIFTSPFLRAERTAHIVSRAAGWAAVPVITDERLREKELGLLDRLTPVGIQAQYPQEVALRARLGKFYYRPPRGESWADVVLRLRSFLETMKSEYAGKGVMIVTHQVVILCLRYILEALSEIQLLDIDRSAEVANCSLTAYASAAGDSAMRLLTYNFVAPLEKQGAPITSSPDAAKA